MQTNSEVQDVIVVGGGPAGLTAAIYLGRFRRRCTVLEDGHSRAQWIPKSHNIPGFTAGVGGSDLLSALREQALQFGAQIQRAHVSSLDATEGVFSLKYDGRQIYARHVILATGVRDHLPAIGGVSEAVLRSVIRLCPICDAFEAIDKHIAVISDGPRGEREAAFLRSYSAHVTLLDLGKSPATRSSSTLSGGIERIPIHLADLNVRPDGVTLNTAAENRRFDVVYLALGCSPQQDLARSVCASRDEQGILQVNSHQQTTVPGLYAAGDVVRGLNQVIVAAAESAIAATDIHNKLRTTDRF
jgi:thioredoxin reductase (NADPH)